MNRNADTHAVIKKIVQRLVSGYPPERIILFGSYAYGQPDTDSDIDLLIIKATEERFFDRLHTVRRVTAETHPHIPIEPIVLTPAEVQERLKAGDQFLSEILQRGEVLYAS